MSQPATEHGGPLGNPAERHLVEALLRQALFELDRGQHVELVVSDLLAGLDRPASTDAGRS